MSRKADEIVPPRITKRRKEWKNKEYQCGAREKENKMFFCRKSIKSEPRCREQGGSGDRVTDGGEGRWTDK